MGYTELCDSIWYKHSMIDREGLPHPYKLGVTIPSQILGKNLNYNHVLLQTWKTSEWY